MKNKLFYFKGVLEKKETKEEKTKRIQKEFLTSYKLFQMLKNG
jgi:hypothetical protein